MQEQHTHLNPGGLVNVRAIMSPGSISNCCTRAFAGRIRSHLHTFSTATSTMGASTHIHVSSYSSSNR